jgi:hypothetical protein
MRQPQAEAAVTRRPAEAPEMDELRASASTRFCSTPHSRSSKGSSAVAPHPGMNLGVRASARNPILANVLLRHRPVGPGIAPTRREARAASAARLG